MCSLMPIRCFSCGKVVADKQIIYENKIKEGLSPKTILDCLNINKYCCRRMFLGHIDLFEELSIYEKKNDKDFKKKN